MDDSGNILVKRIAKSNVYVKNTTEENSISNDILKVRRLGQVRLGQVRLGQVRLGQVRLGQVRLGQRSFPTVFGHSYGNINPTVKIPRLRLLQFVVPLKISVNYQWSRGKAPRGSACPDSGVAAEMQHRSGEDQCLKL